jgi:hypothetical protein
MCHPYIWRTTSSRASLRILPVDQDVAFTGLEVVEAVKRRRIVLLPAPVSPTTHKHDATRLERGAHLRVSSDEHDETVLP